MKLISWNVNGIRSLNDSIRNILANLEADILCLQEVKANRSSLEDSIINVPGYSSYFSFPKHQSGYSGVATFCRNEIRPSHAEEGLSGEFISPQNLADAVSFWPSYPDISQEELKALESEGRALLTKHSIRKNGTVQDIVVVNVYCPRVDCLKAERATYQQNFFKLLQRRAEEIQRNGCGVLIVGDINTCRHPIDSCDPGDVDEFSKRPNRIWLNEFVHPVHGLFIDSFRHFYPEKKCAYTCWSTLTGARKTNYGTRIDYALVDKSLVHLLEDSLILSEVEGSDHCPVGLLINCQMIAAKKCPSVCSKYWPEFSGHQKTLTSFLKVKEPCIKSVPKRQECDTKPKQLSITKFINMKCVSKTLEKNVGYSENQVPVLVSSVEGNPKDVQSSEDEHPSKVSFTSSPSEQNQNQKSSQVSAWRKMLSGPPKPPKCSGHQEVCLLRTVQKEGPNYGRQFFVCPRPIGDKSNKEARCDYFKWAVDVKRNNPKNC